MDFVLFCVQRLHNTIPHQSRKEQYVCFAERTNNSKINRATHQVFSFLKCVQSLPMLAFTTPTLVWAVTSNKRPLLGDSWGPARCSKGRFQIISKGPLVRGELNEWDTGNTGWRIVTWATKAKSHLRPLLENLLHFSLPSNFCSLATIGNQTLQPHAGNDTATPYW